MFRFKRLCILVCLLLLFPFRSRAEYSLSLVRETALSYIVTDESGTFGFYDKKSGFYQPPLYDAIYDSFCTEWTSPILVNQDGYWGYVSRESGETRIPLRYTAISAYSEFCNGYALAAYANRTADSVSYAYELIDCDGNAVPFPRGVMPISGVHEGRVVVVSQHGNRYGVADIEGNILVSPRYDFVTDFSHGYASVRIGRLWGHIDMDGAELVPPQFEIDDDFGDTGYAFDEHGFATLHMADGSVLTIDAKGRVQ